MKIKYISTHENSLVVGVYHTSSNFTKESIEFKIQPQYGSSDRHTITYYYEKGIPAQLRCRVCVVNKRLLYYYYYNY